MDKLRDTPRYHRFRMRFIFPFALLLNIVIFVQSISDAITLSYLYLIDAGMCLCWFSLAVPTFTGFMRRTESAYRWNWGYETFMIAFLLGRTMLYMVLIEDRSIGLLLLLAAFTIGHICELIWYYAHRNIFTKL